MTFVNDVLTKPSQIPVFVSVPLRRNETFPPPFSHLLWLPCLLYTFNNSTSNWLFFVDSSKWRSKGCNLCWTETRKATARGEAELRGIHLLVTWVTSHPNPPPRSWFFKHQQKGKWLHDRVRGIWRSWKRVEAGTVQSLNDRPPLPLPWRHT